MTKQEKFQNNLIKHFLLIEAQLSYLISLKTMEVYPDNKEMMEAVNEMINTATEVTESIGKVFPDAKK